MKLHVGTSGFSYREWRGGFYPAGMKEADMLPWYAARFDTVELNNTFYRMPKDELMQHWLSQVPAGFEFSLKASRYITHLKRLNDVGDAVAYLFRATAPFGEARGPVLFGLPPNFKLDLARLHGLLASIPDDVRCAIEFRHESWHDDAVFDALRDRNVALCIAETDEDETPFVATADWGYVRLRREEYGPVELEAWKRELLAQEWTDAYVYFRHEETASGPRFGQAFMDVVV
jgi:uncharacterized protein YecE (DUF72 family)